jgi:SAM-dependent methyltransferase
MSRFDAEAANWDDKIILQELANATVKACRDNLGYCAARAMDFGAGTGLVGAKLLDPENPAALKVVGVDASQGMVAQFQAKAKRFADGQMIGVNCMLQDETSLTKAMEGLPADVPRKQFDLITSQLAYHHIEDIKDITKTLSKYLAPGGLLCVVDYEASSHSVQFHPSHKLVDSEDVHHSSGFTKEQLKEAFEEAGLVNVNVEVIHTMYKRDQESEHLDSAALLKAREAGEALMEFPVLAATGKRRAFVR